MHKTVYLAATLTLAATAALGAQRRVRIGPTLAWIALEDQSGKGHSFTGVGGSVALITGDDGETGLTIARYHDLSTDGGVRRLTLFALDSYYYPVGTRGVAPFAATTLGLARVTESATICPLLCADTLATSSQFALAFGLGVRVNLGNAAVATVAGRFLQVPGSQIQALELAANASVALGSPRTGEFLEGTLGPVASFLISVSGPLRGRAPFIGMRFRRDTKKSGTIGLQIDFASLHLTESCTPPGCQQPNAILFAPGYEASAWPTWGRFYGEVGLLLAGFYTQGPDRGVAQGLHGGIGVDLYGGRVMWNVNSRLLWLQRSGADHRLGLQLGVGVPPRLGPPRRQATPPRPLTGRPL